MIQNSMKSIGSWNSFSHLSGTICSVFSSHNAYNVHTKSSITWIIDSGATNHIVSNVSLLQNPKTLNYVLHLPNGTTAPITHIGDMVLSSQIVVNERWIPICNFR